MTEQIVLDNSAPKKIQLTQGQFTLVDSEDYEESCNDYNPPWYRCLTHCHVHEIPDEGCSDYDDD